MLGRMKLWRAQDVHVHSSRVYCAVEFMRCCNRDVIDGFYHAQFITIVKQMSNVKKVITLRIE